MRESLISVSTRKQVNVNKISCMLKTIRFLLSILLTREILNSGLCPVRVMEKQLLSNITVALKPCITKVYSKIF